MKKSLLSVVAGAALLCATSGFAGGAEMSPNTHEGFYLGGNLGTVYAVGHNFPTDWGFGFTGLAGYQFNRYFAAEAGALYSPNLKGTIGSATYEVSFFDAYVAAKGILPLSDKLSLFAKVGPAVYFENGCVTVSGSTACTSSDTTVAPYVSAGVGYMLTDNLEFTAETGGIVPTRSDDSASFVGNVLAGLIYHFSS